MSDCKHTEERLVDYLEGTLPPQEHGAIAAHAARCRACGAALAESRAILDAYRAIPDEDVSAEVAARLRMAARPVERRSRRVVWRLVGAAAILVALVSVFWIARGAEADPLARLMRAGAAHVAAGEAEAALASYEEALARAGRDERAAEILHRLGELHVARGDFARALARLDQVVSAHGAYADLEAVLLLRGRALEGLGERDAALDCYRRIAAKFPRAQDEARARILTLEGLTTDEMTQLQALGYGGGR